MYSSDSSKARHTRDHRTSVDLGTELTYTLRCTRLRAHIDHARAFEARANQREHSLVGLIGVEKECGPAAHRNAIPSQITARGTCEHHTWTIVSRKGDQPLNGTGREDDAFRPNDSQPLAQPAESRRLVGRERLERPEYAMAVSAKYCCTRKASHALYGCKVMDDSLSPLIQRMSRSEPPPSATS